MTEFWESSFQDKQAMWGFEPADSAIATAELFKKHRLHHVLIPGFGYGRNAKVFTDNGFEVTGIEISATAVGIAKKYFGESIKVYQGPVSDMPFDQELYDGIFCYALIHLLDNEERAKLINDCYSQLRSGGLMVFVAISKGDATYGQGQQLSNNRFLTKHGVNLFFYDSDLVEQEFGEYGLIEAEEISEPAKSSGHRPTQRFWQITCRKK